MDKFLHIWQLSIFLSDTVNVAPTHLSLYSVEECELEQRWPWSTLTCPVALLKISKDLKFNMLLNKFSTKLYAIINTTS